MANRQSFGAAVSQANTATNHELLPACPYPGIEPFPYACKEFLFGRNADTQTLIRRIVMYRGVLFYAASGTGKSSLINAGLIPLAMDEGYQPEKVRVQPKTEEEIIVEHLSQNVDGSPPFLPSIFASNESAERAVLSVAKFLEILRARASVSRPLLIFDQFEEWITLFEESSNRNAGDSATAIQKRILDAIVSIINDGTLPVKVLISFREDYLAKLSSLFERCPHLSDQYLRLTALKVNQIHGAIRGPFEKYPGLYTPELSPRLAREITRQFEERSGGGDIRLTEVQIVCRSLFEAGKQGTDIEEYFAGLGVQGVLERYLEHAVDSLETDQRDAAVGLLSRLVTSAGTRNVISRDDLMSRVEIEDQIPREFLSATLNSLDKKTMLVRRELRREVYYYEIASEFLIAWIRNKSQERQHQAQIKKLEKAQRAEQERNRQAAEAERQQIELTQAQALAAEQEKRAQSERLRAEENERWGKEQETVARHLRWRTSALLVVMLLAIVSGSLAWKYDRNIAALQKISLEEEAKRAEEQRNLANLRAYEAKKRSDEDSLRAVEANSLRKQADSARKKAEQQARTNRVLRLVDAARDNLKNIKNPGARGLGLLLAQKAAFETFYSEDNVIRPEAKDVLNQALRTAGVGSLSLDLAEHGHAGLVSGVAYNSDGKFLLTSSEDGTVKLWESSGREVRTFSGHQGRVYGVAFSPDGMLAASGGIDGTAKLWDITSGKLIRTLAGHTDSVRSVAFSPDGTSLATSSDDGTVKLWEIASGRELRTFTGSSSTVYSVGFSPDGNLIASASADGTTRLWDVHSEQGLHTFNGHQGPIYSVAFSPDGKSLATVSADQTMKLWDVTSDQELHTFYGHEGPIYGVAFSPDGKSLATVGADQTTKLWNVESGKLLRSIVGHADAVRGVAFNPNGRYLATAGADGTLRLWRFPSGQAEFASSRSRERIEVAALSPDGKLLATVSGERTAKVWDVTSGKEARVLSGHEGPVYGIAFSPDGKLIATGSADRTAKIWDASSGTELRTLSGHSGPLYRVAFSPDGKRIATASADRTAKIWDVASGNVLQTLSGHSGIVRAVAFSQTGQVATGSDDNSLKLWNSNTGKEVRTFVGHTDAVRSVVFSQDGKLASGGDDGTVKLWDPLSGKALRTLSGHTDGVRSIAFSRDGKLATSGDDGTVRIWDIRSGTQWLKLTGYTDKVVAVFFISDTLLETISIDGNLATNSLRDMDLIESVKKYARLYSPTYEECQEYNILEPKCEALELSEKAFQLAADGNWSTANVNLKKALNIDPELKLSSSKWNVLCRDGSLERYARDFIYACER